MLNDITPEFTLPRELDFGDVLAPAIRVPAHRYFGEEVILAGLASAADKVGLITGPGEPGNHGHLFLFHAVLHMKSLRLSVAWAIMSTRLGPIRLRQSQSRIGSVERFHHNKERGKSRWHSCSIGSSGQTKDPLVLRWWFGRVKDRRQVGYRKRPSTSQFWRRSIWALLETPSLPG